MKKVNAVRPKNENNFLRLLLSLKLAEYKIAAESFSEIVFFLVQYSFLFEDTEKVLNSCGTEQSQLYALQENRGLGARYLNPKYSMWISADPAMNTGEYFPVAPTSEDARSHNQNLPGLGGVFNTVNLNLYHYAANNPIKYIDPDGRKDDDSVNWLNEIFECVNSVDIGLRDELDVNIPGFINVNAYLDLMSVGTDDEDNTDAVYSQGVGVSLSLKFGNLTLIDFSLEYSRKGKTSEGYNCPLGLFGNDFEFSSDLDMSSTYDLTIPIPGFSVSINLSEVSDLYNKVTNNLEILLKDKFDNLFSKEENK